MRCADAFIYLESRGQGKDSVLWTGNLEWFPVGCRARESLQLGEIEHWPATLPGETHGSARAASVQPGDDGGAELGNQTIAGEAKT